MEKAYERKRHRLEENYWLFRARREIIFKLIKKINAKSHSAILDVGCGGGHLIKFLERKGFKKISGIDISNRAVERCKKRGIKDVFVEDGAETKFDDKMFDIIIADNVLEHIKDENVALNEWNRILKKNGRLIVFVPAFSFLWSQHDERCHHYRRYSKSALIKALEKANFEVERSSYWNFSLFFPISLVKISQQRDQLYELNPVVNRLLIQLLKFENWLLGRLNFPVGVSVFGVARKK